MISNDISQKAGSDSTNIIQNIQNGYLLDGTGSKSSKRLWGSALLTAGVLMGCVLFSYGLIDSNGTFTSSYNVMQTFIFSGSGLLGLGLFENLKGLFNKQD